jgi:hypothetical protein
MGEEAFDSVERFLYFTSPAPGGSTLVVQELPSLGRKGEAMRGRSCRIREPTIPCSGMVRSRPLSFRQIFWSGTGNYLPCSDLYGLIDFQNGDLSTVLIGFGLGMPKNNVHDLFRFRIVDKQF